MSGERFTPVQENWLRKNYNLFTFKELSEEFNKVFNTTKSKQAISDKCNKQMKLKGKVNRTSFALGDKVRELPIGTIRVSQGAKYIKVMNTPVGVKISGYAEPYWKPLQKKIYEDVYGEIPSGKMVCFLDQDRDNLNIDNLYCISRKVSIRMAQNNWWTKNKQRNLVAIKWCELLVEIKDLEKKT